MNYWEQIEKNIIIKIIKTINIPNTLFMSLKRKKTILTNNLFTKKNKKLTNGRIWSFYHYFWSSNILWYQST